MPSSVMYMNSDIIDSHRTPGRREKELLTAVWATGTNTLDLPYTDTVTTQSISRLSLPWVSPGVSPKKLRHLSPTKEHNKLDTTHKRQIDNQFSQLVFLKVTLPYSVLGLCANS